MWLIMLVLVCAYVCMSVCLWAVLQAGKACIIVSSAQCWCFHMLMTFQGFLPRFRFLWCCTKDFALLILCNAVHFPHEHTIQIQARVHVEPMAYCMLIFSVFCVYTLSRPKVLVRANPQPCSKALRIMAALVVGGALASPNGLGNLIPHISTLMSTVSMVQWNRGSLGVVLTVLPWRDCRENTHVQTITSCACIDITNKNKWIHTKKII